MEESTKRGRKPVNKQEVKPEPEMDAPVNCLRNERVIVKHVAKESAMIHNPKHILYGGMAENAVRYFTVPMQRNGQLVNVLTNSEKDFLEDIMGLESNALSIYKKGYDAQGNPNNFWSNYAVRLTKADNYLDLSAPEDYIKYKVLLANTDFIAPDLETLQNYPKATYEFVIIREEEEAKASRRKLNSTLEAYKELGKLRDDTDTLRVILETLEGRPYVKTTKSELIEEKIDNHIQSDAKLFLKVVGDPFLNTKVLIRKAVESGIISNRGGLLYMRSDGTPLCNEGDPTLSVAAKFLNEPKHQDLKFTIEEKLKNI